MIAESRERAQPRGFCPDPGDGLQPGVDNRVIRTMTEAGDRPHSPGKLPEGTRDPMAPVAMRKRIQQGLHKEERA